MKYLFTDKRLHSDVEDFVFLYNHMALKTANEAIIESMGCIVDLHASPQRHLKQLDYSNEALIHWNGPRPHEAKHFLAAALDMHFGTAINTASRSHGISQNLTAVPAFSQWTAHPSISTVSGKYQKW